MDIFELIRAWGLDKNPQTPRRFSKREVDQLIEEIDSLYTTQAIPKLGSLNPGIRDGLALFNADGRLNSLTPSILLSEQVWLSDPLFSAIAPSAANVWSKMPDSGSTYFTDRPTVHTQWKSLPQISSSQRKDVLRQTLSTVIPRLLKLEPLVKCNAIDFYSWERIVENELPQIRDTVITLKQSNLLEKVTTSFPQNDYSLGTRLGSIGIKINEPIPGTNTKAGDQLWLGEKTPVLVYGLLNAAVSDRLACRFDPSLLGDRIVYDFARSNGKASSNPNSVASKLSIPALDAAVWEDVLAIRNDSELLHKFRQILGNLGIANTGAEIEAIRYELESIALQLNSDSPLRNIFRPSSLDLFVGILGGVAGAALAGDHVTGALIGATTSSGTSYLKDLAVGAFGKEAKQAKIRQEVVTRIAKRF